MNTQKNRLAYILLAIFLGCFGVHNFYAGFTKKGLIQLVLGLLSWLILPAIILFIWIIMDIVQVTKDSDGTVMS